MKPCSICNVPFAGRTNQLYCSRPCANRAAYKSDAYRRAQEKRNSGERSSAKVQRTCAHCGSDWMVDSWSKSRFCTISCAKTAEPSPSNRPRKPKPPLKTEEEMRAIWMSRRSPLRVAYEDRDYAAMLLAIRALSEVTDRGCWRWMRRIKDGYPIAAVGGKHMQAHRLSLEAKHGAPLGSQHAHHICATTWCVNPDHLQPVTHRENVAEMMARQSYLARIRELEAALGALDADHPLLDVVIVA